LTVQKEGNRKVERKFKHNFWRTIRIGEKNKKNKLNHTLCIVTRYFGGIKLGAGTCGSYYEGLIKNGANFAAISVLEYILLPFLSFSFINISIWVLWLRFKWW
jgi:putative IMPACT (imprinted ancient) family translation regulator